VLTDLLYPSTATLASSACYTALTTQATSAVTLLAHLSIPLLVLYHLASNASLVCQLPALNPKPKNKDTVLIFSGNNLPYKQLTMRLAHIEWHLIKMEHMHQLTCHDLGHAAKTNTQNFLQVSNSMYNMLVQVSTSMGSIYKYLTCTGQLCDEVNIAFNKEAHHLDYHVKDVMQETHNLWHFIEDTIRLLTHNIHRLQWMLDHCINTVHGQYGNLAECVKEHYHNNWSNLQEILHCVQCTICMCG
jgi:hypothetical protein